MTVVENRELSYLEIDPTNTEQWLAYHEAWVEKGMARVRAEMQRMYDLGIIDAQGNSLRTDLPEDMLPASETDVEQ